MWHPKPECGITQLSSRFAFYNVMTSLSSSSISPSTTISLVALVGHWEKVGKAIKQSINQASKIFDSMTTTAQRAAVVKIISKAIFVGQLVSLVYNSHMGEDVKMTGEERANPKLLEKG